MTTTSEVWRTRSDLRWTYVSAPSVTEALVQLARVLDDFDLEPWVTGLQLFVDDDRVTVGALTEESVA